MNALNYLSEAEEILKESTTISLFEDEIFMSKRFRMVERDLAKRRCDIIEQHKYIVVSLTCYLTTVNYDHLQIRHFDYEFFQEVGGRFKYFSLDDDTKLLQTVAQNGDSGLSKLFASLFPERKYDDVTNRHITLLTNIEIDAILAIENTSIYEYMEMKNAEKEYERA